MTDACLVKVLNILQNHYVETLGRAIVINLPMILNFFYKAIGPFLDPVTKDKVCLRATHSFRNGNAHPILQMRFNPDLFELIPKEQLDAEFGGDYEFEFDADTYWSQIIEYVSATSLAVHTFLTFLVPKKALRNRSRWHSCAKN